MPNSNDNPSFVTLKSGDQTAPKTITGILPLQAFLVQFRDHENKECVRVAFNVEGTPEVILLAERVAGGNLTTHARAWFAEELKKRIDQKIESAPVSV